MPIVGRPFDNDYIAVIETNIVKKFLLTVESINIAEKIFGLELENLKGKTTCSRIHT